MALGVALVFGTAAGSVGTGAARNIRFQHITIEDGLSQASVYAVTQDRHGFMWFGTESGLNRFDGYEFKVYKHDLGDDRSLPANFVWFVHEDRAGDLWVGTRGGGLGRLERRSDTFDIFHPGGEPSPEHDNVRAIHEDPDGSLWLGTDGGGLHHFDPRQGTWRHFAHDPADPASLGFDRIRALHGARDGSLWIATFGGGLDRFDRATGTFEHHLHRSDDPGSLSDDRVFAVIEGNDGAIWAGTYAGGLNRLDPETGRVSRHTHAPEVPGTVGPGRIRALTVDRDGILWVGTDGGLCEWRNPGFACYEHDPADARSLGDDKVTRIFQNRGGVLWVATQGAGLSRWNPWSGFFRLGRRDPEGPNTLSSDRVTSFQYDEPTDTLWIGTFGGGLNRLDRVTGRYTHYRQSGEPHALPDDNVMSLALDRSGTLWIGTYKAGLVRFDPRTERFAAVADDPRAPREIGAHGVMALLEDEAGRIWAGTFEGGLFGHEPGTGAFIHHVHDPADPSSLAGNTVTALFEDSQGTLWVGTERGGLCGLDRTTGRFERFRHDPDDPASLGGTVVFSIREDPQRTLWIGTQDGGLSGWAHDDRKHRRGVFSHHTERAGLPDTAVYGILAEASGALWLSTNQGLARLDPGSGAIKTYDAGDGLQSNEFNFGAYHQAPDGEMFFGGIRGFNAFHPDEVEYNRHVPPVLITSIRKNNAEVHADRPVHELEALTVDHTDYVVSLQFAALDFASPYQNAYAYKLEGFDADWIELGSDRRATYTNLDAGEYRLLVRGANNDGVWSPARTVLRIHVNPPPWRTWWAYTGYALLLVGSVAAIVRGQVRRLGREAEYRRQLEREVEARTRELAQRNRELETANGKLEQASLTDQLTGLHNRRYLMTEVDRSISLTERHYRMGGERRKPDEPDYLFLMIDLDGLKGINDTYGHMAGDRALLQMRDLLIATCRETDTIIRWGGDEFLVVGRNLNLASCERLAERIRQAVADHAFDLGEARTVGLSCSVGFAHYPFLADDPTLVGWEQVATIADRALYVAKRSGRNAWVAIFGNASTPREDLVRQVNEEMERLAATGAIDVLSSVPDPAHLVWGRD